MKIVQLFLIFFFTLPATAQIASWKFDETSGANTIESVSNTTFPYVQGRNTLEKVPGVSGMAFRSDGYTTWLSGVLPTTLPNQTLSICAWLALESYPVKTASVLSIWNENTNQGLEFGVNKFGQTNLRGKIGTLDFILNSPESIPHYAWVLLSASLDASTGQVKLFQNNQLVLDTTLNTGFFNFPDNILIGKANNELMQGPFPLSVLNGIIDEVNIWEGTLSIEEIDSLYSNLLPTVPPSLTVPETRFTSDVYRPKYHPIPQAAWTNESHGLIYYQGQYHMFSQKNSNGPYFSNQNWGHFISDDLLFWREVQPALWPENEFDSVGTWAGHLILDEAGQPVIFYTGVDGVKASTHIARALDSNLINWEKPESLNPIIAESPFLAQGKDFRDPFVFRENGSWYMIIGSGTPQNEGTLPLYKSADLENWDFIGSLYTGNPILDFSGSFWEVPVFRKFGDKYVLLVTRIPESGNLARCLYWVGDFINEQFVPDQANPKNFEIVNGTLSPAFASDAQGNTVAIGIIPDEVSNEVHYDWGWANLFSLPRIITLDESTGTLIQKPHPILDSIRQPLKSFSNITVNEGGTNFLEDLRGFQYEIKMSIEPGQATEVGLIVGSNASRTECTKIIYNFSTSEFVLDRINSTFSDGFPRDNRTGIFPLEAGERLNLRVFIDGSVLEVFVNDKQAFAGRYFPASPQNDRLDLFATGGDVTITSLEVFAMGPELIPTGILDIPDNYNQLQVFPNPASKTVQLSLNNPEWQNVELVIVDAYGKKVLNRLVRSGSGAIRLKLDNRFSPGIYQVYLKRGQEILGYRRLSVLN